MQEKNSSGSFSPYFDNMRQVLGRDGVDAFPPDSPLRLFLFRQALFDPNAVFTPRAVDSGWFWYKSIQKNITGFNPNSRGLYFAKHSPFAEWVKNPMADVRGLNGNDTLIHQVLFLLHDYLHVWAYDVLATLVPDLVVGTCKISKDNFEDLVFLHLVTEAVATVGLDYWFLSTVNINRIIPVGTNEEKLTISYDEEDLAREYSRFAPDLKVQTPKFFETVVESYCNGLWRLFHPDELAQSPKLKRWLDHEQGYGVLQRRYSRQWLAYLANGRVGKSQLKFPDASVKCDAAWHRSLVTTISELLWEKIKSDKPHYQTGSRSNTQWASKPPERKRLDFRFTNLNAYPDTLSKFDFANQPSQSFQFFVAQFVSRYDLAKVSPMARTAFPKIAESGDPDLLRFLFEDEVMVEPEAHEPVRLFFPN